MHSRNGGVSPPNRGEVGGETPPLLVADLTTTLIAQESALSARLALVQERRSGFVHSRNGGVSPPNRGEVGGETPPLLVADLTTTLIAQESALSARLALV